MNFGRIAIAAVTATVVYYVYGFLVEGLLIRKAFSAYSALYRSAETMPGYGAVMKEYVTVPDKLLRNTKELQKYFELSHAYTKTLKPKPSQKGES
jgi:hypothetical protein